MILQKPRQTIGVELATIRSGTMNSFSKGKTAKEKR